MRIMVNIDEIENDSSGAKGTSLNKLKIKELQTHVHIHFTYADHIV